MFRGKEEAVALHALFFSGLQDPDRFRYLIGRDAFPERIHLIHHLGETDSFRGADPFKLESLGTNAQLGHLLAHFHDPFFRPVVRVDIMTVADMAAAYKDHGSTQPETFPDELFIHPTRTHGPDEPDIRGVLQAGYPGVIRPGVGTPVTGKGQDLFIGIFFQQGVHLAQDLIVGKMVHGNGPEGAFGGAGPAPGTGSRVHHGRNLSLHIHA